MISSASLAIGRSLVVVLWAALLPLASFAQQPVKSIAELDISRYTGTWYEIAKLPNWFQRKCTQGTQAQYKILGPQKIEVTNKCTTATGEEIKAVGVARPNSSGQVAHLEVRFAPDWTAWLPLVWGAYWVLDLDPDYQLAAVGDPTRSYLWILSRSPVISATQYENLLQRLKVMGFDITKLEKTRQN
jgi:apolipoprotein D and lipocalin family protein